MVKTDGLNSYSDKLEKANHNEWPNFIADNSRL